MHKIDAQTMERYKKILENDPNSQVFAILAEAMRQRGQLKEAEKIARYGVQRHPKFSGGFLILGKILSDQKRFDEGFLILQKVVELDSQNLLGYQCLGDICLQTARPKEALKYYKMVLFLNPQSEKAQRVVQKLESLTADEYEADVFEMAPLKSVKPLAAAPTAPVAEKNSPDEKQKAAQRGLQRMLSLIDAFIVRNDLAKAQHLLSETEVEFGEHTEISQRRKMLYNRQASRLAQGSEAPEKISPILGREASLRKKKLDLLSAILRVIERTKSPDLAT
jgi:tetratricopeptide (TPR) repeat protein